MTTFTSVTDGVSYPQATHINQFATPINNLEGGWVAVSTWAYASATSITVPSGAASIYSVGDKIKLTQTTVKYFYVVGVADTLLTITGGTSYTLTSATITSPYYSKFESPVGFPQYFNYTPTGIAASNVTLTGRFKVTGRECRCYIAAAFAGAITFTTMPTIPITASASHFQTANPSVSGVGGYVNADGATVMNGAIPRVEASGTVVKILNIAGQDMSATVPITWAASDIMAINFTYEI